MSADQEPKARRRETFVVRSSYGAAFATLRRNGRFLYIADHMNGREYAYELFMEPAGVQVPVGDELRRMNEALIRDAVDSVDALYRLR